MRMTTKPSLVLCLLLMSPALASAQAWVATEQDSAYQRSMAHLEAARQAMRVVQREILAAQRASSLPGFDYERLTGDLDGIDTRLSFYLTPNQHYPRYQHLRPDGIYFFPPTLEKQP